MSTPQFGHPSTWPAAQPPAANPPPAAPSGRARRRPPTWVLAAVGALVVLGAGVGVYFAAFADVTIRGSITLTAGGTGYGTGECHGTGQFASLTGGAQIEVTDGAGKTVGLGKLNPGVVTDDKGCLFKFSIDASRTDFYVLKIGRMGGIKMSRAEAQNGVNLTLS